MSKSHEFSTENITVVWQKELCSHSANCVRGLPAVFQPGERPWIKIDAATADEIASAIDRCPSGALSYRKIEQ